MKTLRRQGEGLVQEINQGWADSDREFLLSFKRGEPDWSLFPLENPPAYACCTMEAAQYSEIESPKS
jgi:hypothetical protein